MWYTNRLNWLGLLLLCAALLLFGATVYFNLIAAGPQVTPTAPLPARATLQKHVDSSPSSAFRYVDTYSVDAPPLVVVAFYKKIADDCSDNPAPAVDLPILANVLLTCVGPASPRGGYVSRIGYDGPQVGSKTILMVQVSW